MKLPDVLILAGAIGLFVIGIDQYRQYGLANSYWIFMFVMGLLGLYRLRKRKARTIYKDELSLKSHFK